VREVTELNLNGVERVGDKSGHKLADGGPAFCAAKLFGNTDATRAQAGCEDLAVFMPPNPQFSTLLIRSHLGTGKTTLFRAMARATNEDGTLALPRILYISGRRSFTADLLSEFRKRDLQFYNYQDFGDDVPERIRVPRLLLPQARHCDRLFVQLESLHRFLRSQDEFYAPRYDGAYDAVILDEIETILATLKPSPTHEQGGQNYLLKNAAVFEALVSSARVVVAGDAFVSQRSLDVLRALRGQHAVRVLDNTYQPYARTVERIRVFSEPSQTRGGGKHRTVAEKAAATESRTENVAAGISAWVSRLVADLTAGKRVVVVMGSRKRGLQLEEQVIKPRFVENAGRQRLVAVGRIQVWWRWLQRFTTDAAVIRFRALGVIARFITFLRSRQHQRHRHRHPCRHQHGPGQRLSTRLHRRRELSGAQTS
jgi:hypothetical protein